jgi:NitT/TauT family transport system substrate-binding protein
LRRVDINDSKRDQNARKDFLSFAAFGGAVFVISPLSLVGCSSKESGTGTSKVGPSESEVVEKKEAKIAFLVGAQLHQPTLPIGIAKGYFEEEGLQVNKLEFSSGGNVIQQIGELDFAMIGINPAMIAKAQGSDVVVFANLHQGGSALVVDPSISKFEDLKDQPVATPGAASIQHNLYTMLEEKYNTPTKKITANVTDMPIFAMNKEIKGAIAWEPITTQIVEMAGFKVLFNSQDIMENQQCCVWVTSKDVIENNREMVEKITKINAKVTRFMLDHPEEAIEIIAESSGRDLSTIAKAFPNMVYPWPPRVDRQSSMVLLDALLKRDVIEKDLVPDMDAFWKEFYDESFEQNLIDSGYIAELEKASKA